MKKMVKKESGKYVTESTFEKHMASIAKSFARVEESLKNQNLVTEMILKEIKAIHEGNKYFRDSISNLNTDGLSYDRKIENLTARVEKLESK